MNTIKKTLDYFNKRMVLLNELKKIQSQKKEITNDLRDFFTSDKIINQPLIFNRPNKWGDIKELKITNVNNNHFYGNDNKLSSYYSEIELLTKSQIIKELSIFQDVKELEISNVNKFNSFFDDKNLYLYAYAYDTDSQEFGENYIYEYIIIQINKEKYNIV